MLASFRAKTAIVCALGLQTPALNAQATDPRFDAIASLAEAKMKEFGVRASRSASSTTASSASAASASRTSKIRCRSPRIPCFRSRRSPRRSRRRRSCGWSSKARSISSAPVRTYLPDFRVRDEAVSRDVTVWHLLTHLGGWEGQVSGPDRGTETLKNFVGRRVTDLMQVAPPGAAWSYNNAGFSIAGRVIEAVTGTSINRAIRDLVFQPLGLEHAGTTAGEFIVQRFAAGHSTRNGTTTLQRPFVPSSSVTAGGVGLCITDLLAYARFHMGDGTAAKGERV